MSRIFWVFLFLGALGAVAAPVSHEGLLSEIRTLSQMKPSHARSGTVLIFMASSCPLNRRYSETLGRFAKEYPQVEFFGLFPGERETEESLRRFQTDFKIPFPVLRDLEHKWADTLWAERTPEVFVFNGEDELVYRGRIDDQYQIVGSKPEAKTHELRDAILYVLKKGPLPKPVSFATGCHIPRKLPQTVSFKEDVAPIIYKNCTPCHRANHIAGYFPLVEPADVALVGETLSDRVQQRLMPPWSADRNYNHFENDRSLDINEIWKIARWVEEGALVEADATAFNTRSSGDWHIGKPDAVLYTTPDDAEDSEKYFDVPASGVVDYQHFKVKTNFDEDKWVVASEIRPLQPEVVHHVNVFLIPEMTEEEKMIFRRPIGRIIAYRLAKERYGISPKNVEWVYRLYGRHMEKRLLLVGSFNPSEAPLEYPEGFGFVLPKGAELIFECHYTPNGKATRDRTAMGLKFAELPKDWKQKQVFTRPAAHTTAIQIEPNGKLDLVKTLTFHADVSLLEIRPHMHLRGKSFTAIAEFPSGEKEIVLHVPQWNYEWQMNYRFEKPLSLPRGTKLHSVYRWDNTENNLVNPDPNQPVKFGLQIKDEMALSYPMYVYSNPDDIADAEWRTQDDSLDLELDATPESLKDFIPDWGR